MKRCPDDGACHHGCTVGCFRVAHCEPLSGIYPGNRWPVAVVLISIPVVHGDPITEAIVT